MKPDPLYVKQAKPFWAHVRTISQHAGYTERRTKQIKIPTLNDIMESLRALGLTTNHILDEKRKPTEFAQTLLGYYKHRADVLNNSTTQHRAKNQWKNEDAVTLLLTKTYGRTSGVTRFAQTLCGNTTIPRVFSSVLGR